MMPLQGSFTGSKPVTGIQGGSTGTGISLNGGGTSPQSSPNTLQVASPNGAQTLQPTQNPNNLVDPVNNSGVVLSANTTVDPAAQAAAAKAAADAAQAALLRQQIAGLVSSVKGIYDGRYGQVDDAAREQSGKLTDRFGNESQSLTDQVGQQNQQAGAAFAGNGTFDSSYRGNAQDQIATAGKQQIDALGNDLKDNLATVADWVQKQKAGFDAGKGAMDTIVSRLADETDPNSLISLRNQIDNQIATLQSQSADNNTQSSNRAALETIAPSSGRAQQLKVTLNSILGGNADATTKTAIGSKLIASADLTPADQSKLLQDFHASIAAAQPQQQDQTPVA